MTLLVDNIKDLSGRAFDSRKLLAVQNVGGAYDALTYAGFDITGYTAYDMLELEWSDMAPGSNAWDQLRVSTNGTSVDGGATNYMYSFEGADANPSVERLSSGGNSLITLGAFSSAVPAINKGSTHGSAIFHRPQDAAPTLMEFRGHANRMQTSTYHSSILHGYAVHKPSLPLKWLVYHYQAADNMKSGRLALFGRNYLG